MQGDCFGANSYGLTTGHITLNGAELKASKNFVNIAHDDASVASSDDETNILRIKDVEKHMMALSAFPLDTKSAFSVVLIFIMNNKWKQAFFLTIALGNKIQEAHFHCSKEVIENNSIHENYTMKSVAELVIEILDNRFWK